MPPKVTNIEIKKDAKLAKVGGNMSARQAIEYKDEKGKTQKGLFTSQVSLNDAQLELEYFREYKSKYPQYADFFNAFEARVKRGEPLSLLVKNGLPGFSKEDANYLLNDPEFGKFLSDFGQNLGKTKDTTRNYAHGMKTGSEGTVELRNVALSNMAKLMGAEKLVADSRPMRLKQGNFIQEGIFMELAEGVDAFNVHPGDPITTYPKETYDSPQGLKALSDLQILDYICDNSDRHFANMLYQFEEVDGKTVFSGIKGIDNDLSFGAVLHPDDHAEGTGCAFNDIKTISKEQADFVMSVTKEQIEAALDGCRISGPCIDAVMARVEHLREAINSNKIEIVGPEQWADKTMDDLAVGNNIFSRVKTEVIEGIQRKAELNGPREPGKGGLKFTEGKEISLTTQEMMIAEKNLKAEQEAAVKNRKHAERSSVAEKIIQDRMESYADVLAEKEQDADVVDPLSKDSLKALGTKISDLNKVFSKADHLFGRTAEYKDLKTGYKDFRKFVETISKNKKELSRNERMHLMEDMKEQLQYLDIVAAKLEASTQGAKKGTKKDHNDFAKAIRQFSKEQQKALAQGVRAGLQKQEEVVKS